METINELSQIHLEDIAPNLVRVRIRQNHWIAGEIDTAERIFYSAPRSQKNVMFLYTGGEGGLGVNEEILSLDLFDVIKIKFNDKILTTTRRKWLALGTLSRYCSSKIDRQLILKFSCLNQDDAEKYEPPEHQEELFGEVSHG